MTLATILLNSTVAGRGVKVWLLWNYTGGIESSIIYTWYFFEESAIDLLWVDKT